VLECSRVIDELRAIAFEDVAQTALVSHRSQDWHVPMLSGCRRQAGMDAIQVLLGRIQQHEAAGIQSLDGLRQCRTNGSAGSCDQDVLSGVKPGEFRRIMARVRRWKQSIPANVFNVEGHIRAGIIIRTGDGSVPPQFLQEISDQVKESPSAAKEGC
jgi:hypothetical protein